MIKITDTLAIDERYISYACVPSSGAGGQNVNKVATAVQLRFDVINAPLPHRTKRRLKELAGSRMTKGGELLLQCSEHRTQEKNKKAAVHRLIELIQKANERPKFRVKTKPTKGSQKRRLESKARRGSIKTSRRKPCRDDE